MSDKKTKFIQRVLNEHYGEKLTEDGKWGPKTEAAFLRHFSPKEDKEDTVSPPLPSNEQKGDETDKERIQQVLNIFETGSRHGDYSNISMFYDGPGNIKQVSYGRSQTTEFGNLRELIEMYIVARGKYSASLSSYINKIGKKPSLVTDRHFIDLLKKAGDDPIMHETQDKFFDIRYWRPAESFFKKNGFTHPLSMLVIYDSYIHSGSILSFLRKRFPAKTPADGGNEKDWISQYVNARHSWLANHSRPILRKTIYRTRVLKDEIAKGNWDLDENINVRGIFV